MLKFAVLGEVRAWRGETELDLGSKQRRALLAVLLLRSGRSATVPELIDGVWGEHPTPSAVGALRNHILHLRRVLEPDRPSGSPPSVLVGFGGGYALRLPPGVVDVEQVEDLLQEIQAERIADESAQQVESVRDRLEAALRRWSGTPLAGLPGPYADRQRTQLVERRLALLEQRIELDLQLGRYAEVIAELSPLCAEHPMREQTRGLLMTALYHAGRQAEALAVYADTRRALIERLGIEPGQQLAELHHRILRGELPTPRREEPVAEPVAPVAPRRGQARIAQLPADVADFTGRGAAARRIMDWLTRTDGCAVPVCAIGGMGGIGKSALAVHVAHRIRDRFPDGQLHVDMHGFAPARGRGPGEQAATAAIDALGDFLRALGVPEGEIAPTLPERSAQFRSCLDGKRVLVVLDNVRDVDQVRPLIPGTPGSAVLVTSRSALAEMPAMLGVRLDTLATAEAHSLLSGIAGERRVAAEPAAVEGILAACGGLPLAVRIVGARLAARPNWSLTWFAERLVDEQHRLAALRTGDLAVEAAFRLSYDQLDPGQARAFRMLAVPDVAEISLDGAAAILGIDHILVEELCESLVDLNLMETTAEGRYTYHDLLRLFARDLQPDPSASQPAHGPLLRLLDFYLATVKNVVAVCNPGTKLPEHLRVTGATGLSFGDSVAAVAWLNAERPNLVTLHQQSAHVRGPALALSADIAWATAELIDGGPNCQELARSLRQLLDAALEVGDREVECRIRVALGALCADSLGDLREGRDHQRIALSLNAGSITGTRLTAFAAALLAASTRMGVESAASLAHAERAIRLARRVDDRAIECQCLVHMAKTLSDAGRFAEAEERARQARMLARQLGNPGLEATALQEVGASRGFQGDHQAAIELCDQAVRLARRAGLILREGWALARLGQMYMLAGQLERGEESADAALRVLTRATGPLHRARVLVLHGILLQALGRTEQSYCVLRSAAEAFAPMHDVHLTHERVDAELEAPIVFVLREHLDEVIAERARRREGIVSESTVG